MGSSPRARRRPFAVGAQRHVPNAPVVQSRLDQWIVRIADDRSILLYKGNPPAIGTRRNFCLRNPSTGFNQEWRPQFEPPSGGALFLQGPPVNPVGHMGQQIAIRKKQSKGSGEVL